MACFSWLPLAIDGTTSKFDVSETNVKARTIVSTDVSKSGVAIMFTMLIDPKLQLTSDPKRVYCCPLSSSDGVWTCKISEHKFDDTILPAMGLARLVTSILIM